MLFLNQPVEIDPAIQRRNHQRNAAFQRRFAMENYLQDHSSELSVHWIEASDAEYDRISQYKHIPALLLTMLYGC